MKTAQKNPTELTYQYNKAYDLVSETLSRMTFLLESAPNNYTDQNFSRDGLSGMGWVVGDMVDRLQTAETILKKLANIKAVRA